MQPVDQAILAEPLNGLLFQLNGQPWVYATSLATSELVGYARSASITDAQRGTINTLFGIDIRQAVTLTRELITELTATDTGILFDGDGNLKTHDALDDTFDIFEAAILFDTYMTDNAATRNTFNTYFGIDPTLQVFTNPDYRDRLFAIVGDLDYADPATFFADLTSFDAAIADFMDAYAAFTAAEQANIDIALAAYVDENGVSLNVSLRGATRRPGDPGRAVKWPPLPAERPALGLCHQPGHQRARRLRPLRLDHRRPARHHQHALRYRHPPGRDAHPEAHHRAHRHRHRHPLR